MVPGPPSDPQIHRCSSPLCKMAEHLHVTYAHPRVYFQPPREYLRHPTQCECCIVALRHRLGNHDKKKSLYLFSAEATVLSHHCRVNYLVCVSSNVTFVSNIFNLWLAEPEDTEPTGTEGQLYVSIYSPNIGRRLRARQWTAPQITAALGSLSCSETGSLSTLG